MPKAPFPVTITITTGRSGSTFLYSTLKNSANSNAMVSHELLHPMVAKPAVYHRCFDDRRKRELENEPLVAEVIRKWKTTIATRPVVELGWTMSSLAPLLCDIFGESLRIIILHRHPVEYAASATVMGRYSKNFDHPFYAISPSHEGVLNTDYLNRWHRMSSFEKNLFQWLETVQFGLEMGLRIGKSQSMVISLNDLKVEKGILRSLGDFVGFPPEMEICGAKQKNESRDRSLEARPLGDKWKSIADHPAVVSLAIRLGYDMSDENSRRISAKYQRPAGIGPMLRSMTKYWQIRAHGVKTLRGLGVLRKDKGQEMMNRQRNGKIDWP